VVLPIPASPQTSAILPELAGALERACQQIEI
jgi:hypothetical protein